MSEPSKPVLELDSVTIKALVHIYALAHFAHRQATPREPLGWQFEVLEQVLKPYLPVEVPASEAKYVRVTGCSSPHYWYRKYIGHSFKLLPSQPGKYTVDVSHLKDDLVVDVGFIDYADGMLVLEPSEEIPGAPC